MDSFNYSKHTLKLVKDCLRFRLRDQFKNDSCTADCVYELDLGILQEYASNCVLYQFKWAISTELRQILESTLGSLSEDADVSGAQLATVFTLTTEYALDADRAAERIFERAILMQSQGRLPIKIHLQGWVDVCPIDPSASVFHIQAAIRYVETD
jgi:hypothetical protein